MMPLNFRWKQAAGEHTPLRSRFFFLGEKTGPPLIYATLERREWHALVTSSNLDEVES